MSLTDKLYQKAMLEQELKTKAIEIGTLQQTIDQLTVEIDELVQLEVANK